MIHFVFDLQPYSNACTKAEPHGVVKVNGLPAGSAVLFHLLSPYTM